MIRAATVDAWLENRKSRPKNSPRIGGLSLYSVGENCHRTRLNGFAQETHSHSIINKTIKRLIQEEKSQTHFIDTSKSTSIKIKLTRCNGYTCKGGDRSRL